MKECPLCHTTYADETLNFCLSDGVSLISLSGRLSEETVVRPRPNPEPIGSNDRKGVNPVFAYLLIGLVALLVGGSIVFWMKSDTGVRSSQGNENNAVVRPSVTATPESIANLQAEKDALEKERQKLADDRRKLDARKAEPSTPTAPVMPASGNWFVVLGSYSKSRPDRANQRLSYVKGLGYSASIIDTDNYAGLRDGYYSIVLGPYSKDDAKRLLISVKQNIRDAYVKSGM